MLSILNIKKTYNEKEILQGVSFSAFPGSIILLKGPNGSGKSTLLKIIAGLLTPTNGFIYCNGYDIARILTQYQNECVSYLGTKLAIKQDLTVFDYLKFWAELDGEEILILAALKHFGLDQYSDTLCGELSSGWQQRLALAKLIVCNKKIWLLDEPDTYLDDAGKDALQKLITVKATEGGIVIVASHNIKQAQNTCVLSLLDFVGSLK